MLTPRRLEQAASAADLLWVEEDMVIGVLVHLLTMIRWGYVRSCRGYAFEYENMRHDAESEGKKFVEVTELRERGWNEEKLGAQQDGEEEDLVYRSSVRCRKNRWVKIFLLPKLRDDSHS